MKLTFLQAGVPLTKSFAKQADGTITKSSYPSVYEVTSIEEHCPDLRSMEALLKKHAALGNCLVKGNPTRPLTAESRAGTTDSNGATDWIVLDVDGIPGCATVEDFLRALNMDNVSYVVQYSASYGITSNDLRAHIYMQIAALMAAPLIKQWLIGLNHTVPMLRNAMTLTKTGNSVSWPLDISACQNDKLLYIAPPLLKGIKDPFSKRPRIEYVAKQTKFLTIPVIPSTAANQELTTKRINEIRVTDGLPVRKTRYKMHGATRVMCDPDSSIITDMKVERGFVYFNLNGGDSWAYYHPEDNPDYVFNFKDEPAYLTKELLPDYWKSLTQQAVRTSSQGVTYLAFCDRKTGAYWRGTHDGQTDTLELYLAKNETQIRHFAKQHGMPLGDFIPEWDLMFDPHDNVRVDVTNKTINTFEPTSYMQAPVKKVTKCPPTILRVIHHVLGGDIDITEHFMNWLACILQTRDRTLTAWVLHGVPGTGKGILMNKIIRPIFGNNQTAVRRMDDLAEPYNAYMEKCFIVFADEVQTKALVNEQGVMAKLRNFITEEMITVRAMYQGAHEVRNYTNWIFSSNMADPVAITKDDRRHNVGRYQKNKLPLVTIDKDLAQIEKELQAFHDYLMTYAVDRQAAMTPIDTEDRNNMISISESSIDTVGSALLEGNFEFFVDQLPANLNAYQPNVLEANKVENFKDTLKTLLTRTNPVDGKCNISRDELRVIFDYTVGNIPTSPNKFTSLLKHHRIHTTKVWIDPTSVYGIQTHWKDVARFKEFEKIFKPAMPAKGKVK
jgi:hypothetical protein